MRDIGANLASSQFSKDLAQVIERARAAGVSAIDVTGTSVESSHAARRLALLHPGFLFSTAGVHPHAAKDWSDSAGKAIADLLALPETLMAGEMGLDYERDFSPRADQIKAFEAQLEIASDFSKPLFLHCRGAHEDFLRVMDKRSSKLSKAIVHCFTDGPDEARAYLERGFHIGVTGWVADPKRGGTLRSAVEIIPVERLLIETDAPYLMPLNKPGSQRRDRNEPAFLAHVAQALAAIYGVTTEEIARATERAADALIGRGAPAPAHGPRP